MLYVFGFQRTAVVLSDLYFVDPDPKIEGRKARSTASAWRSGRSALVR